MKIFFDTETTGLPNWKNPEVNTPRMVQLGLIVTEDDGTIRKTLGIIFKSEGYSIPKEVSDIHGITDEIANAYGVNRTTDFFWQLADCFHNANEVIAHNYSFDKIIVNGEFISLGLGRLNDAKSFCTKEASIDVCKVPFASSSSYGPRFNGKQKYKWPKLSEVYKFLFNENIEGAHDALTDVRATMRVYFELKKRSTAAPAQVYHMNDAQHKVAVGQLQDELTNVIARAADESDLLLSDIVGVLEILKFNVITNSEIFTKEL